MYFGYTTYNGMVTQHIIVWLHNIKWYGYTTYNGKVTQHIMVWLHNI